MHPPSHLISEVINKECSVGTTVVEVADTVVLLLASRVPDLQLDGGCL